MFLVAVSALLVLPSAALAQQGGGPDAGTATGDSESHLFIGATARALPAGHGYFSVRELGLGAFQVGVTDRFSIGAGTVLWYPKAVVLTPKYQVYRGPTVSAAVGVAHLTRFGKEGFGVAYGVVTKEFENGSLTSGVGWLYARAGHDSGGTAVAMIGGERRISSRVDLVTENYVFVRGGALTSAGVRVKKGRFTSEFGLMAPIFEGDFIVGPIINLGYKF